MFKVVTKEGKMVSVLDTKDGTVERVKQQDLCDFVKTTGTRVHGVRKRHGKQIVLATDVCREEFKELKKKIYCELYAALSYAVYYNVISGNDLALAVLYDNEVSEKKIARRFNIPEESVGIRARDILRRVVDAINDGLLKRIAAQTGDVKEHMGVFHDVPDIPIRNLSVSARLKRAFIRAGFENLAQVLQSYKEDKGAFVKRLIKIREIGELTVEEAVNLCEKFC